MIQLIDQIGNNIQLKKPATRIVSLVPSISELICDLDLEDKLIGITKFCVHPKNIKINKQLIGGTKNINIQQIIKLKPDLIIANREENTKEDIEKISSFSTTYVSNVQNITDTVRMIKDIGVLCDRQLFAEKINKKIESDFEKPRYNTKLKKAIYLIWNNPLMSVGGDTFISHLMEYAGYKNVFNHQKRYPVIEEKSISLKDVDEILLSTEPYPFKEKHIKLFSDKFYPIPVRLVNGEFFSWYGSRLLKAKKYFDTIS